MGFLQIPILRWCQFMYWSNRAFDFFENYCSNFQNQNAVQMPHSKVHSGDQIPPSQGHLKPFHIIHYVGALTAESADSLQLRQSSFYSNLFCDCFIIKKTNIKHTCSCQILIMNH